MKVTYFHLSIALIHKFVQCAVLEMGGTSETVEVGYAPFMQGVWTEEVLSQMYAKQNVARASLVESENDDNSVVFQLREFQDYWVHDPTDDPTSPQHGWVHVDAKYKPHVHIFAQDEGGQGIECSEGGTSVQLATNHVEQRNIRIGSLLLIEQCATPGIDVKAVQVLNATHAFLETQPVSLADISQHVERQRFAFHVPLPDHDVPISLDEAHAEFEAAGIRTQKHKIHRVKLAKPKQEPKETPIQDSSWTSTWANAGNFSRAAKYNETTKTVGATITAHASLVGTYATKVTVGTKLTGECVGDADGVDGFKAYITGIMKADATATLTATAGGAIILPLSAGKQQISIPIFLTPIPANVLIGGDMNLIAKLEGTVTVETGIAGEGEVTIGGYYNRATKKAMPIYGGKFLMTPKAPSITATVVGSLFLDIALSFGMGLGTKFIGTADVELVVNIAPGVNLNVKNCGAGKNEMAAVDLNLDIMCGAKSVASWSAFYVFGGSAEYTLMETKSCDLICDQTCTRHLMKNECTDVKVSKLTQMLNFLKSKWAESVKEFKEIYVRGFCDEKTSKAYEWDGDKMKVIESKQYVCEKNTPPSKIEDIVFWPETLLKPSKGSVLAGVDDYYQDTISGDDARSQ